MATPRPDGVAADAGSQDLVKENPTSTIFNNVQGPGEVVSAARTMCQRSAPNGLVARSAIAPAANSGNERCVTISLTWLKSTCANNAHNSPAVTSSRALPIRRLRMASTPSGLSLALGGCTIATLPVHAQFVNVLAVGEPDPGVCSLIGVRGAGRCDTSVIVSEASSVEPRSPLMRNDASMSEGRAMERPWLSVIVPCHNGERWLAAALQSVVDQQDGGLEIIVVDGSATYASLRIVASFADKLLIRAERRPDLLSWTAKTNFGVEQARGDRICMLHQDDLWLPDRCAEIANGFPLNPTP